MKRSEVNNDNGLSATKRSMLKAAWVAPLVVAVTLPRSGYASRISGLHRQDNQKHDKDNYHPKGHSGTLRK